MQGDVALLAQVAYDDDAAFDAGERAVAAVAGVPDGAADGRGAVAPAGSEAPAGGAAQPADDAAGEPGGGGEIGRASCRERVCSVV